MYVPFEDMPNSSRIWIYQSNKKLSDKEVIDISKELQKFCENWAAHSQKLKTSFSIKHKHFIVLAVDENKINASGCSIDSSLKTIKKIEEKHSISLLNRHLLSFYINNEVKVIELGHLQSEIKLEKINNQSVFFNNLATSIEELSANWMVRAEETWLKKYF